MNVHITCIFLYKNKHITFNTTFNNTTFNNTTFNNTTFNNTTFNNISGQLNNDTTEIWYCTDLKKKDIYMSLDIIQ